MSKTKDNGAIDASTEEKIKNAARTVFQKKGFAATRTRDIAEEAGINLALLNYYYRSKEKLYELIVIETLSDFMQGMIGVFNDENSSFEEKITTFVERYINKFIEEQDIPFFILSVFRHNPEKIFNTPIQNLIANSVYARQFQEKVKSGEFKDVNFFHHLMNMFGILIMPFVAKPFLCKLANLDEKEFNHIIEERKKMIPAWIKAIMSAK